MPRFFIDVSRNQDALQDKQIHIAGGDAKHITKVLRMKPGEQLTVCDCMGTDYFCQIESAEPDDVSLTILNKEPSRSEPDVRVTLYQALPKSEKMDLIIQKSVELGVYQIVPVITGRCVSRPDKKALANKTERWNKIAAEAAKQCGRGVIPKVLDAMDFRPAAERLSKHCLPILFYEKNGGSIHTVLDKDSKDFGIFIGSEGGFEEEEAALAQSMNIKIAGLGPRILRTETAPLCALSVIMYATGNL